MRTESQGRTWRKNIPESRNGKCQVPMEGTGLVYPKDKRMTRIARAQQPLGRVGDDSQEVGDDRLHHMWAWTGFQLHGRMFTEVSPPHSKPGIFHISKLSIPSFMNTFHVISNSRNQRTKHATNQPLQQNICVLLPSLALIRVPKGFFKSTPEDIVLNSHY